jgi:hypothetical protein
MVGFLCFTSTVSSYIGDITYSEANASQIQLTGKTASDVFTYNCPLYFNLTSVSLYTRTSSGARTLTLLVDGATTTTQNNSATPAFVTWSGLDIQCTDGTFDFKFVPSAVTYYVYGTQGDISNNFKLVHSPGGTSYGITQNSQFSLPVLASTSTSASVDFTEVTNVLEIIVAIFFIFSLLLITIKSLRYMLNFKR